MRQLLIWLQCPPCTGQMVYPERLEAVKGGCHKLRSRTVRWNRVLKMKSREACGPPHFVVLSSMFPVLLANGFSEETVCVAFGKLLHFFRRMVLLKIDGFHCIRQNFHCIRRLIFLPSSVVLSAIGSDSPLPMVPILGSAIPLPTNAVFIEIARLSESNWLSDSVPTLSVCPMIVA